MEDLIFKAEQGDAEAQFALGEYYYRTAEDGGKIMSKQFIGIVKLLSKGMLLLSFC